MVVTIDGVEMFRRADAEHWSYERRDDGTFVLVAEFPAV